MLVKDLLPFNWNANLKAVTALLAIIGTMVGSAHYLGSSIYHFSEQQTRLIDTVQESQNEIKNLTSQVSEVTRSIAVEHDKSLDIDGKVGRLDQKVDDALSTIRQVQTTASTIKGAVVGPPAQP